MVELAGREVEPADQSPYGTVPRVQRHKSRLDLGHLADAPALVACFDHSDHRPRTDLDVRASLVREARGGGAQALPGDVERLPILPHRYHLARVGVQHHRREQIVAVRVLIERFVHRFITRRAGGRQRDEQFRAAVYLPPLVVQHPLTQRPVGRLLLVGAQAGRHVQAAGIGLVAVLRHHGLAHHLCCVFGVYPLLRAAQPQFQLLGLGGLRLGGGDEAVFEHPVDDVQLSHPCALGIAHRVVGRGRFGQTGQHRRLGDRHVLELLAKIGLCGGREAICPLAQEDLVHVDLQDLLLGQQVFQLEGQQHLIDLAGVGLVGRQVHVARHLHGDGGRTLALGLPQVGQRGAHHALVVHPAVLEKPRVFDRQHGVLHHVGNLGDGQQVAPFLAKFPDQLAVGREHAQRQLGAVVGQVGDIGQVGVGHGQCDADAHEQRDKGGQDQARQGGHRPRQPLQDATARTAGAFSWTGGGLIV